MAALPAHATRFLRGSGVVEWDETALASARVPADWCRMLHVVAQLEADTAITARHARTLGIDRSADFGAFVPVWAAEEAEHARGLQALLAHQAYEAPGAAPASIARHRRLVAGVPRHALGRVRATRVVYATLGAAAEYVTVLVYGQLAAEVDAPAAVGLLHEIARQERRHCAFFLSAARLRAARLSRVEVQLTRRVLHAMWRPPGVPSLGAPAWRETFAPLLDDAALRARVRDMDRVVGTIPHLEGLQLMERFLARAGVSSH